MIHHEDGKSAHEKLFNKVNPLGGTSVDVPKPESGCLSGRHRPLLHWKVVITCRDCNKVLYNPEQGKERIRNESNTSNIFRRGDNNINNSDLLRNSTEKSNRG